MLALGIESTAHTLGIAVAEKNKGKIVVKSNVISKYPSSLEGFIPRKLADHHVANYEATLRSALEKAKVKPSEIDLVAFSQGPGIGHCLHVGYVAGASLAENLDVPLVGVNHTVAHMDVGRALLDAPNPLVVYVSGGNTQIGAIEDGRFHVYGETLDIGLGNLVDNVGRLLKLEPPDAVGVLKAAPLAKKYIALPYTIKGMSMTFSGLLTAVEKLVGRESNEDLSYSVQETAFSMLVEASERALTHTRLKDVLLCGGNARNKRLQEMLRLMCEEQGVRFLSTPDEHSGDAGGMIAVTGIRMREAKVKQNDLLPRQRMRIDSAPISW
ncbi:MAG TPA: tRNA (adenosine(37)-N6)-threonylcarbamoyltransferase complex transferase subunit TsaD [Candidatus Norongarragalinales archaeon]|jgi:glycoprotease/Kae1 family metallohydrolase|nr:tRNA (adenosine(37)-N6)-threonylcarbamoyltransferase complex transferase subunit TsaD [Candidatus Norongarragalinales archaeon]